MVQAEPSDPRPIETSERFHPKWKPMLLGVVLGILLGLVFMGMTRLSESRGVEVEGAAKRFVALLEDRDQLVRAGAVARLFSRINPTKVSAADIDEIRLAFEESSQLHHGDIEFALLGAWWARFDPEAASQWTRTSPRGASRRVLVAVMNEWGSQDLPAALLAAQAEKSELRRRDVLAAALTGADRAIQTKSKDLVSALEEVPNRDDRRTALQALIARQLRRETPGELLARAAESREDWSKDLAEDWIAATAMVIAKDDPVQAVEFLSAFGQSGSKQPPGVVGSIASGWSADDPVATLEWLSTLGPDEERSDAVRATYRRWLVRDHASAIDWAAQRAETPEAWFDPIRANYAFILGHKKPREGLHLLFMLPVDDERAFNVQQVFARWKARDPEPAEAWLQEAELPEYRKEQLRRAPSPTSFPQKRGSKSDSNGAAES